MNKQVVIDIVVGNAVPQRGGPMLRGFAQRVMGLFGWTISGQVPNIPKFVVIGAPHTSNWDWFLTMFTAYSLGINISWMMKHTMFRWPLGGIMRWMGGIPIDRRASHGVVAQTVERFVQCRGMVLCITPEGTRRKVNEWKVGFYHIAQGAGVPIVPAVFDYGRKQVRFAPAFTPTGNLEEDLPLLKAVYADATPKNPHLF